MSYTYNELSLRKKRTNARGQVRQFFYDAMGRMTGCTSPEGTVSYTYDANGNVLTVTDSHGTITRTFDALNRVTSCTDTYGKIIATSMIRSAIFPNSFILTIRRLPTRMMQTGISFASPTGQTESPLIPTT